MKDSFVVDNSVVMAWCFKEEKNDYCDYILDQLKQMTAIVPSIWPLEVVNVLLVAERNKRLKKSDSTTFLQLLAELPIVVENDWNENMMSELLNVGRVGNLSSYDSSYLSLASKRGIPLATQDKKIIRASFSAGVEILK